MAQDKKSFLLYCDVIHTVNKLTDEQAGNLFKHILMYVNDENPTADNIITELTFEPIKQALKRDLAKWEAELDNKSVGGRYGNLKRWHKDLYDKVVSKEITLEDAEIIAKNRIASHTDKNNRIPSVGIGSIAVSDSVSVSVIDSVIDINNKKNNTTETKVSTLENRKKDFELLVFTESNINTYGDVMLVNFFDYWTEKNTSGKKMRFEMEKVFEITKRLTTWSNNNKKFNKFETNKPTNKLPLNFDNTRHSDFN